MSTLGVAAAAWYSVDGRLSGRDIAAGDPDKDKTLDKAEYLAIVAARLLRYGSHDQTSTRKNRTIGFLSTFQKMSFDTTMRA